MTSTLGVDEAAIVAAVPHWESLRGAHLLITGGTGFVGRWLLAGLAAANAEYGLGAHATVLTRDAGLFARVCPNLAADAAVDLLQGDVRAVRWPGEEYSLVVHGAASSDASLNEHQPEEMLEVIELGTRRVLDLSLQLDVRRLLLLSSGAVYQPPAPRGGFSEDSPRGSYWPDEPSAYHAGKRRAEDLALEAAGSGLDVTVARLFAFVGPHLPLDRHFAIGNFIGDVLEGHDIHVRGDGTPVRSYLYAADMAAWLWVMLLDERAAGRTYNVGSERAVSIAAAARLVAAAAGRTVDVTTAGGGDRGAGDYYVPVTGRARRELGLGETVALPEAIRRTLAWHVAARAEGRAS